jgi:NAD(P)H dehydrogenase (quinone)
MPTAGWGPMRLLEEDNILSLCGIELLEHLHFDRVMPDLPKRSVEQHLATVAAAVHKHWGKTPVAQG